MSSEALARPAAAAVERTAPRRRRRRRPSAWHLLLFPLALVFIFPFVQMLFASLMTAKEINAYPPALFPHHQSLQAYRTVLQESGLPDLVQELGDRDDRGRGLTAAAPGLQDVRGVRHRGHAAVAVPARDGVGHQHLPDAPVLRAPPEGDRGASPAGSRGYCCR